MTYYRNMFILAVNMNDGIKDDIDMAMKEQRCQAYAWYVCRHALSVLGAFSYDQSVLGINKKCLVAPSDDFVVSAANRNERHTT
jgi:hypothetical protein